VIGRADIIRYFGVLAQAHLHRGGFDQAFEAAQAGLRMIRQKPFAGSWTMEGYAGVAETFLSLLEMNAANQYHAKQNELMVNTNEACQAMRAFSRIFSIAQPRAWLCLGWYDWIAGKDSNANRTWQKGLVLAGQLTMPYEQARAHYEIGRHLKNAVEGKFHLEKAHDIYTNLGVSAKVV
jgi:tetratricopeptide (TPR) repeat protein